MDTQNLLIIIIVILLLSLFGMGMVHWINQDKTVDFLSNVKDFRESDVKTKEDLFEIIKKVNNLESVKITTKEIYPEEKIRSRILISDNKERRDTVDEESGNIVTEINDFDKMEIYTYHPEVAVATKKEATKGESFFSQSAAPEFLEAKDLTILGDDRVNGKECVVIESSIPGNRGEGLEKSRGWIWKDYGLIVKGEMLTLDRGRVVAESEIEFVDIPDKMFRLPKNVHIIDETK